MYPVEWYAWGVVVGHAGGHIDRMSAIYRLLIQPLLAKLLAGRRSEPPRRPATAGLGLALGGGFARGFAHIGVLRELDKERIPLACIAGTSIGSIIGTAYASGVPLKQIAEICRHIRFKDFARWKISRRGLASNDRLGDLIRRCFGALRFEELRIPTAVVTTNLVTGEPTVFTRGEIVDPIRASCAFPGLFEPVKIGSHWLSDGGLTAPIPTKAAAALGARYVLGVSVGFNNWHADAPENIFQVVSRAISIAQKHRNPSWERFADILIEPAVQDIEWDEFGRADEAIEAGAAATRSVIPRLREMLNLPETQLDSTAPVLGLRRESAA